jgi:sigma-B regulation protein RsbU (phosphoserine phosphatase)
MGQLGVSKTFFFDGENGVFRKRGFRFSDHEQKLFDKYVRKVNTNWFFLKVEELAKSHAHLQELLLEKKIHYLINISETEKKKIILGMGLKFNRSELTQENIEFAFFVSRFALIAIENAILINKIIENKRIEHEIKIARDIQQSLLPQELPEMENFEVGILYKPINEVGGDYYDILKKRRGAQPLLIADVEGKGLSAALLAASSQAVFHSLNELYFFEPCKFVAKANSLIYDFTRGNRFITLCWLLLEDKKRQITYVNAGHVAPFYVGKKGVKNLSAGGFLTGFVPDAHYQKDTLKLQRGDLIVAFTDGVPEAENPKGEELGEGAMIKYFKKNSHLSAPDLVDGFYKMVQTFCQQKKMRDDFTLLVIKAK